MSDILNCTTCSKESYANVPVMRVLEKLDECFATNDLAAAGRLLEYWEREALILNDERGLLEILNEEIGYYRRTSDKEKAISAIDRAIDIIDRLGINSLLSTGTVYLNAATTLKAFNNTDRAMKYYNAAKSIYLKELDPKDFRLAAYYNNVASAYTSLGDTKEAENCYFKALDILEGNSKYLGEQAITHVSLAHLYYDIDNFDSKPYDHMEKAWELLTNENIEKDGNLAFVCSKCYPSFGFFGYFEYEQKLKSLMESIYEGN